MSGEAAEAILTRGDREHKGPWVHTGMDRKIAAVITSLIKPVQPRTLLATVLFFCCAANGPASATSALERDLIRYNRLQLSAEARVSGNTDNGEIKAFRGYQFKCRKEADFQDEETQEAKTRFDRFLQYAAQHDSPDAQQKQQRLSLLQAAIAAGSWRADYLDVIWGLWANRGHESEFKPFADRLYAHARSGLPIAVHAIVEWNGGMYEDIPQRTALLKAAIERGNPNAMASVGYNLGTHDLALRPMAKQMLDCAAAQGEPSAYDGIARLAWHEGRWVDAHRAWVQGANLGCERCLQQVESDIAMRPGHRVSDGTYNTDARYKALRTFYESQFLYGITHMNSLRVTAPAALHIQVSDEQIVQAIKARIDAYGLP